MPIYEVTYAITRLETYRVDAAGKKDAEDFAFEDGEHIDTGETTNVHFLGTKKVKL